MGRFANKVSAATKQRSSTIKVNPYELPEKALAVIANICTKQNMDDASIIFDALLPVLYREYQSNVNQTLSLSNLTSALGYTVSPLHMNEFRSESVFVSPAKLV